MENNFIRAAGAQISVLFCGFVAVDVCLFNTQTPPADRQNHQCVMQIEMLFIDTRRLVRGSTCFSFETGQSFYVIPETPNV